MNIALTDIVQYGGWAVAVVTAGILGKQQLSMTKFELEIAQRLKSLEDTIDLRFDENEKDFLLVAGKLEKTISNNTIKINSCSGWIKVLSKYITLVAIKHNVKVPLNSDDFSFNPEDNIDIMED